MKKCILTIMPLLLLTVLLSGCNKEDITEVTPPTGEEIQQAVIDEAVNNIPKEVKENEIVNSVLSTEDESTTTSEDSEDTTTTETESTTNEDSKDDDKKETTDESEESEDEKSDKEDKKLNTLNSENIDKEAKECIDDGGVYNSFAKKCFKD